MSVLYYPPEVYTEVKKEWDTLKILAEDATPETFAEWLWNDFIKKASHKRKCNVLSWELEILHSLPYQATVYRKQAGKWHEVEVEGYTPLTAHIIGEIDIGAKLPMKVFHRFIGKTFPQYVSK